jgi:vacuolar-type H+-ATPase subunit E/Vma4
MARQPLVDAIRREAEAEVAATWEKARAEVEACEAGCARAIATARREASTIVAAKAAAIDNAATHGAEKEARRIQAIASAALAGRLHTLAVAMLPRLRTADYPEHFAALAQELPARTWQRVIVNPADEALARAFFPSAQIDRDATVAGGLIVETDEGRVRVDNSLRTRLDAAWPDLLPALMRSVRDRISPR